MATLLDLETHGIVSRFDPQLSPSEQEQRCAYFLPRAVEWIEKTLPQLQPRWLTEVQPDAQLDSILAAWARGDPLIFERQFKPLVHLGEGIWEFKTYDLRLFGWFTNIDCFVCSSIGDATSVKDHNLYKGYVNQALRDRTLILLDEPKFIGGDDPNGVVSNFSYP